MLINKQINEINCEIISLENQYYDCKENQDKFLLIVDYIKNKFKEKNIDIHNIDIKLTGWYTLSFNITKEDNIIFNEFKEIDFSIYYMLHTKYFNVTPKSISYCNFKTYKELENYFNSKIFINKFNL